MSRGLQILLAGFLWSLLCAACASTSDQTPPAVDARSKPEPEMRSKPDKPLIRRADVDTPSHFHHWVQNDQLRLVMIQLGSSSAAQWPSTLPDDPEVAVSERDRDEAFRKGAELAHSLAQAAGRIPASVAHLELSQADRDAFVATANALQEQSQKLGRAARRHNVEEMQKFLDAARATCISCHTRFKDISGELPPRA